MSHLSPQVHLHSLSRPERAGHVYLCRVGIQYVLDLWGGCWGDHWDEIVHAEIGLTQAIMEDGYNVASMQHEYEGLDFRLEPTKLSCRGKLNPSFCCGMEGASNSFW